MNSLKKTTTRMSYRSDAAPNSRLFILAGKGVKEDLFREQFEKYGKIVDFWIVKDRRTNEDKGEYSQLPVYLYIYTDPVYPAPPSGHTRVTS